MLAKFVSKKQANINKGKGKNKKDRRNTKNVSQKGVVDGPKAKKTYGNFEREDRRKTRKKQNKKKRRILKTGFMGEQNRQKHPKLQENILFGPFLQNKRTKTKRKNKNTPPPK